MVSLNHYGEPCCDVMQIGRDPRLSGAALLAGLTAGLTSQGVTVAQFGIATTPAMFMSCIIGGTAQPSLPGSLLPESSPDNSLSTIEMTLGDSKQLVDTSHAFPPTNVVLYPNMSKTYTQNMVLQCLAYAVGQVSETAQDISALQCSFKGLPVDVQMQSTMGQS